MEISINNYNNYITKYSKFNQLYSDKIENRCEKPQCDFFSKKQPTVSFSAEQVNDNHEKIKKFISLISTKEKKHPY